jgi:integrase
MQKDHDKVLQNHCDTLLARRLSSRTIRDICRFVKGWFEKIRILDASGERQLYIWEAMKPVEGRRRIMEFLLALGRVDDDNHVCVRPATVRAYAGQLERLFISTLESPYIDGLQTISSRYGPIENPFTGVQYPVHSRDRLRSERFFLTPEQILELLIFLREVYPSLTNRNSTAARLYTLLMLITETGMRSIEILNLDALGDDRDIFYDKNVIQTRFGKGHNSSGPQTRLMPLTDRAAITLKQYEQEVRPQFRNHLIEPSLFLTLEGKRLSYDTMRTGFIQCLDAARKQGVDLPPNLTIHDLRASFATNFLEKHPHQFWELMELMGHVSHSSTHLYIRSRGKNRLFSMKQARGFKPGRTGFTSPVYNK